jgi:hypothetical protein
MYSGRGIVDLPEILVPREKDGLVDFVMTVMTVLEKSFDPSLTKPTPDCLGMNRQEGGKLFNGQIFFSCQGMSPWVSQY